ncbi:hypothetical protein Misp01_10240 [Microtetraspora sp. NBRC 13810]|uniref:hypothetical protein n=1 Tax=Microtetraspora sp. NBRC 13810 TaxID=3030990 RepID=UPI0024A163A3|nr:hypothetical protein [Microtetraspora sp. NBRC 13810]GLW05894.1 hypothetical protein Misp01_10240 [Microtetraspora sp. NBRC 13810]
MNIEVPGEVRPMMAAMQVAYPAVDTDGMENSGDGFRAAGASVGRSAAGARAELAKTIGIGGNPASYTGSGAAALADRTSLIDDLTAQVSSAVGNIPEVVGGAARVVKGSQTALITIAAGTALAVYTAYLLGGPTGPARANAELLKGRQKWGLVLREADQGANRTLAEIFDRLVTRPLQRALEHLRPHQPRLAPAGPNSVSPSASIGTRAGDNIAKSFGKDEKQVGRANMGAFGKGRGDDPWADKDTTGSSDNVPTQQVPRSGEPWDESEERVEPLDSD